jgi:hypothetical protein
MKKLLRFCSRLRKDAFYRGRFAMLGLLLIPFLGYAQTSTVDITFCIDFTCESETPGFAAQGILVEGGGVVALNLNQGDNIFCTVQTLEIGTEFLYRGRYAGAAGFVGLENLTGEPCANEAGIRTYTVPSTPETVTFAWDSCDAQPECGGGGGGGDVDITFCGDFTCVANTPGFAAPRMFVNGQGVINLNDNQGGNVFCTTLSLPQGSEFRYTFNFSGAAGLVGMEDLSGLEGDCASNGAGGLLRSYTVPAAAETDTRAWESCAATAECVTPGANVEFCVNVGCSGLNPNSVNIFGQFNGFNAGANPLTNQGNGVWCGTVFLPPGPQEYLFLADGVAESFPAFQNICTVTCCGGAFTNRIINIVDGQDQAVSFDWESCTFTTPGAGWSYADVTAGLGSGSASFDPCEIASAPVTINYTATGYNPAVDNHGFAYTTLCGDGEISFEVNSVTPGAYVGATIRETLSPGSKQVSIFSNLTTVLRGEVRYATNAPAQVGNFFRPFHSWLRLTRQGNLVLTYSSIDGANWNILNAVIIPMGECVQVGASLFSVSATPASATISNVNVIEYGGGSSFNLIETPTNIIPEGDWELFPNPATSQLTLRWDAAIAPTQVHIYNVGGQVVRSQILDPGMNSLDLQIDDLANGMYMVEMRSEQQRLKTLRFVKQ